MFPRVAYGEGTLRSPVGVVFVVMLWEIQKPTRAYSRAHFLNIMEIGFVRRIKSASTCMIGDVGG